MPRRLLQHFVGVLPFVSFPPSWHGSPYFGKDGGMMARADFLSTERKWGLWPTPVGGVSCCFTSTSGLGVSADFIPKTIPSSVAVATITNVVFSYQFPLAPQSPGLSTGAKAGIGVGVGCAVLVILSLLYVLFMKKRKERQNVAGQEQPDVAVADPIGKDSVGSPSPPALPPLPPFHYAHRDDPDVSFHGQQYRTAGPYADPRTRVRQEGIFPLRPGAPPPSLSSTPSELPHYTQRHHLPPELGDSTYRERW
ncbi:hypothetical protein GP486_000423 [Trichoglossum hirsutum]|uniref:Transmembrane protein n=1 Tax=Trichoglossum hirsutum TaxID=265104 RepID=A0A9P8LHT3_9PEZI|nr:hypothetical protein GP486_000423 [Trichoglossum hirsutum]